MKIVLAYQRLFETLDNTLADSFYKSWLAEDIYRVDPTFSFNRKAVCLSQKYETFLNAYLRGQIDMRGSSSTIKQALQGFLNAPTDVPWNYAKLAALYYVLDVAIAKAHRKLRSSAVGTELAHQTCSD